jgi:hypothetical protein
MSKLGRGVDGTSTRSFSVATRKKNEPERKVLEEERRNSVVAENEWKREEECGRRDADEVARVNGGRNAMAMERNRQEIDW